MKYIYMHIKIHLYHDNIAYVIPYLFLEPWTAESTAGFIFQLFCTSLYIQKDHHSHQHQLLLLKVIL